MNQEPIDRLEDRLDKARAQFDQEYNPKPETKDGRAMGDGASIGYEFLAYVISGGLLGYGVDRVFGLLPLGLLSGMVFGLAAGAWRAHRRTRTEGAEDSRK
jgi:ATP synthase protein I